MQDTVTELEEVLDGFGRSEAIRHAKGRIRDIRDGLRLIDRQLIALQKDALRLRKEIREVHRFQRERLALKKVPTGKRKVKA